jgi:hypothetical protein
MKHQHEVTQLDYDWFRCSCGLSYYLNSEAQTHATESEPWEDESIPTAHAVRFSDAGR